MSANLAIRCQCGCVVGRATDLSPNAGRRVVCYCDDCQAFADQLGQREAVLDSNGGTEIFQMSPAALTVSRGLDRLACLKLTPRGPLRWYTDCCKTPIGNTPSTHKLPFVGLILACVHTAGHSLDQVLGPVRARVMVRHAIGDVGTLPNAHAGFSLSHIAGISWKIFTWRMQRDHERSLFFDPETGEPITSPLIPGEERRR